VGHPRGAGNGHGNGNGARREAGADSSVVVAIGEKQAADVAPDSSHTGGVSSILPWKRPNDQLRVGYERVGVMLEALHAHFERQDRRVTQMNESLARVADTLEQLAVGQKTQGDCISSIAGAVEGARQHARTLSSSLGQLPSTMAAQAEAARALARHMDSAQAGQAQVVEGLNRFGTAVDTLRESGAAQVAALLRMRQRDEDQKEALTTFIREHNRRLLVAMCVTVACATVALAVGVLIILRAPG
jgi:ABC-type transporter Mla subunit MlaD